MPTGFVKEVRSTFSNTAQCIKEITKPITAEDGTYLVDVAAVMVLQASSMYLI